MIGFVLTEKERKVLVTRNEPCPICGKINKRTYYSKDIGLVEDYFYCKNCGYGYEMCCSPVREYIDLNHGWDFDEIKKAWKGEKEGKQ